MWSKDIKVSAQQQVVRGIIIILAVALAKRSND